ncbi:hypothetical protein AAFF_G00193470 [Aldrovandia affinis]|uniref:Uncharacterized protein n=1 Tax=Aldrovandia affinis TaxID=143900 RepID=A0AAD7WVG3_9TELE|nr:hypothetical protein AAFF_G00193470 [Aldrovandia affinis]
MQSMAGFRAALAVAVVTMEMAVFVMVPAVNSAPVSPNQDLSRGGDREAPYTVQSNPDRRGTFVSTMNSPERREKFLKILMALEELNRSINSSMSSRITMMPRGGIGGNQASCHSAPDGCRRYSFSTQSPTRASEGWEGFQKDSSSDPKETQ